MLKYQIASGPKPGKLVITWQLYSGKLAYWSFISASLEIWKIVPLTIGKKKKKMIWLNNILFLIQNIAYSFSMDWSCISAINDSFTANVSLTSLGIGEGLLCPIDLEINTTSLYFCLFSANLSVSTDCKEVFAVSSLCPCWTFNSREQTQLKISPTQTGEFVAHHWLGGFWESCLPLSVI